MRSIPLLAAAVLLALASTATAQSAFLRGDCNADGSLNVGDPIFLLAHLFTSGPLGPCADSCDENDSGALDIADAVFALAYLFTSGATPPPPFVNCGLDPTADALPCAAYPPCGPAAEVCDNGVDDDLDGDTDCADADCAAAPSCQPLSHALDIQPIWTARCISCHAPPLPPQGLILVSGTAFGVIVNVPSVECPPMDRIQPGSPLQSFLYRKITGTQTQQDVNDLGCTDLAVGAQMPFGIACCLTAGEIDLIEAWILDGANP